MVTVVHHAPVNDVLFVKEFDGLNFDGPAGKHQKRQNFTRQNFVLYSSYRVVDKRVRKIHKT